MGGRPLPLAEILEGLRRLSFSTSECRWSPPPAARVSMLLLEWSPQRTDGRRPKNRIIWYCQKLECGAKAPRKCDDCSITKAVEQFGPTVSNNVKRRCLECEFPRCEACGEKYSGARAIKAGTSAFVGRKWYCHKTECRKIAAAAAIGISKK